MGCCTSDETANDTADYPESSPEPTILRQTTPQLSLGSNRNDEDSLNVSRDNKKSVFSPVYDSLNSSPDNQNPSLSSSNNSSKLSTANDSPILSPGNDSLISSQGNGSHSTSHVHGNVNSSPVNHHASLSSSNNIPNLSLDDDNPILSDVNSSSSSNNHSPIPSPDNHSPVSSPINKSPISSSVNGSHSTSPTNHSPKFSLKNDSASSHKYSYSNSNKRTGRFVADFNLYNMSKPVSKFSNSHFRTQYSKFDMDSLTDSNVRKCLPENVSDEYDDFPSYYSIAQKCVRLWTLESPIYKSITHALYSDNKHEIKKYMAIIRGINKILVSPTSKYMETYRGSKMSKKQLKEYRKGCEYRCPAIAATSLDPDIADNFKHDVDIKYVIEKGCYNAKPIGEYSYFSQEDEVLLPAYTAFKVLHKSDNYLELRVLDNKMAVSDLISLFV